MTTRSAITSYSSDSTQASNSEQQQASQIGESEQQQVQQYTPGTAKPSTDVAQSSQASIQASDLADTWAKTNDNFGVGHLG
ncbi:unnamed protein product [Phytophthora fragariaefolia]|uniref:Unnamed protein product n=1 Tax=Phytophthora fragariaefolia TaxID=1490495 RepID=A0A9W6XD74_9STRA|nr:unnamed protein product [Phytophthora fragariaefolia]